MWNTGYALSQLNSLADLKGQKTKQMLTTLAKEYHVNIVGGSVATKREDKFFNTMYVVIELERYLRSTTKHIYLNYG